MKKSLAIWALSLALISVASLVVPAQADNRPACTLGWSGPFPGWPGDYFPGQTQGTVGADFDVTCIAVGGIGPCPFYVSVILYYIPDEGEEVNCLSGCWSDSLTCGEDDNIQFELDLANAFGGSGAIAGNYELDVVIGAGSCTSAGTSRSYTYPFSL